MCAGASSPRSGSAPASSMPRAAAAVTGGHSDPDRQRAHGALQGHRVGRHQRKSLVALAASVGSLASAAGAKASRARTSSRLLIARHRRADRRVVRPHRDGGACSKCVGGLILITNTRTIFDAFDVSGDVQRPVYLVLAIIWIAAVCVRRLPPPARRDPAAPTACAATMPTSPTRIASQRPNLLDR